MEQLQGILLVVGADCVWMLTTPIIENIGSEYDK